MIREDATVVVSVVGHKKVASVLPTAAVGDYVNNDTVDEIDFDSRVLKPAVVGPEAMRSS